MAVDCVRLLRDYPCKISFGNKNEIENHENSEYKSDKKSDNILPESFEIGTGTKLGIGVSTVVCAWYGWLREKVPKNWRRFFKI